MKESTSQYAKQLIRLHGAEPALRIARDNFVLANREAEVPPVLLESGNAYAIDKFKREKAKTKGFWSEILGIILKAAKPGVSRKDYMLEVVVQQSYPEVSRNQDSTEK